MHSEMERPPLRKEAVYYCFRGGSKMHPYTKMASMKIATSVANYVSVSY